MNESRGWLLLEASPKQRIELHRSAWPETENDYQRIVGDVLNRVLAGSPLILDDPAPSEGPYRIAFKDFSLTDAATLDSKLPPPAPTRDKPESSGFHRWAIELPRTTRSDPQFADASASRSPAWIELIDGSAMLLVSVISPILNELATVFRIRQGQGPQTLKGAKKAIERSVEVHQMLGLDWKPVKRLLDPSLDAEAVISARRELIEGWAEHPEDLGPRAMALLCHRLLERYYGKARKDGTAIKANVMTAKTEPMLSATLGTWDSLLDYLGENRSEVDSATSEPVVVRVPSKRPIEIDRRIEVARRWFVEIFDLAHAKQEPGSLSLWGLVPETHVVNWDDSQPTLRGEPSQGDVLDKAAPVPTDPTEATGRSIDAFERNPSEEMIAAKTNGATKPNDSPGARDSNLWLTQLPADMADSIWEFWGTTVLARFPDVLVDDPNPEARFASILQPLARIWEDVALTCWFLCFGPYSRTTLDRLEDRLDKELEEMSHLGCPIDRAVFSHLIEAGKDHDWLFAQEIGITFTISLDEFEEVDEKPDAEEVFVRLRNVVTEHRKAWFEKYLDSYLDGRWKRDLEDASVAYQELETGRGKPPTLKQAYPKLNQVAKTWFGGDLSRVAAVLELSGPIADANPKLSDRKLPGDMRRVRARVNELLGGGLFGEGDDHWPMRRRFDLSRQIHSVLSHWQASGELPSRPAFGKNWLLKEAYPDDFEAGYLEYIEAVRQALDETDHAAGDAPLAK